MPAASPVLLLLKAHNKGYTKKDGTFVAPFDDKRHSAAPAQPAPPPPSPPAAGGYKPPKWSALASMKAKGSGPSKAGGTGLYGGFMAPDHAKDLGQAAPPSGGGQKSLWGGSGGGSGGWAGKPTGAHKPLPSSAVAHPRKGEKGETVMIHYPDKPSEPATWHDPDAIATFTPGCALPESLNGIPLEPWHDAPRSPEAWDYVEGQNDELEEPGMELPQKKVPASGVIVLEPDGRAWVVAPTNRFAGTKNTFPKGSRDYGLSLQANAIKEAYEESGLKVEIDSFLGDVERSTSVARYYLARRVGGTPAAMGWESQAVRLVPAAQLKEFLDRSDDKKVADWLQGLV